MTSNRPLADWGKLLGDVPSATAILDRFLHRATLTEITGRSYRLNDRAAEVAKADETCGETPAPGRKRAKARAGFEALMGGRFSGAQ